MLAPHVLASLVLAVEEKAPEDEDVVAGWTGFLVFVLLILAVVVIGFALTRSLRTAQRAKDEGVYGDVPDETDQADRPGLWAPFDDEVEATDDASGEPDVDK